MKHLSNKGYLRTLEAVIAVVLTFVVMTFIIPSNDNSQAVLETGILPSLVLEDAFRIDASNITSCIFKGDNTTINSLIDEKIDAGTVYALCPQEAKPDLPRSSVRVESYFFVPRFSNSSTNEILRLYLWE